MGEQIEGGICGGSLWINPSLNLFRSSTTCSSSSINVSGWPSHDPPLAAARSLSNDSAGSASDGPGSVVIDPDVKPSQENVSMASTLQMMGINLSSHPTIDDNWNHDFIHETGKSEENYAHHNLQPSLMDPTRITGFEQNPCFQFNSTQFNYNSPFLQTLFDVESNQQLQMDNHQSINYVPSQSYVNPTEFCPTLPSNKVQKPEHGNRHLQFANNAHFWSSSTSNFVPSSTAQFVRPSSLHSAKPNFHNLSTTKQHIIQENGRGLISSAAQKKATHEPAVKRPRVDNPSPLPAFKVRKEKLGDRITALQQLVSPFGKTDTASVLHEAIEYIKFLHEQVSVLSTPYLKNGSPHQLQHQQNIEDLKSRGLCLVPISSTLFPVATEQTITDFWTPTFGGCFR
ncbi:Transcription factor bHLH112 [Striga hermonthica]|uniref:Transcription factor bHLH112 n=1 Tax=Striga hermonthica TaxID=68872 RepID=A0A9N7N9N5_STRHE|nr:Transcription factor bHLH112 [Striga hermonthica]